MENRRAQYVAPTLTMIGTIESLTEANGPGGAPTLRFHNIRLLVTHILVADVLVGRCFER